MNVFVINDAVRVLRAQLSREGDVVNVLAFLKVAGVVAKVERLVGTHALEHDHRGWDRSLEPGAGKQARKDVAKLFEARGHFADVFFAGVSDQEKVLGADAGPAVFCLDGERDCEKKN